MTNKFKELLAEGHRERQENRLSASRAIFIDLVRKASEEGDRSSLAEALGGLAEAEDGIGNYPAGSGTTTQTRPCSIDKSGQRRCCRPAPSGTKGRDDRTGVQRAKARLGDGGPSDLRRRAAQLENELTLVATLEAILLASLDADSPEGEPQRTAARYELALGEAGLVNGSEDPKDVAARIRATGIAVPVLAALDDWAWRVEGRRVWLQEVARLVDKDPASRPIRDARLWENRPALEAFARSAPSPTIPSSSCTFLGRSYIAAAAIRPRIINAYSRHTSPVIWRTRRLRICCSSRATHSLRYFQAAIALQPNQAGMHHRLGEALSQLGKWDEALVEIEEAKRLDPESAHYGTSLGYVLMNMNRLAEAERHFRKVLETHPTSAYCLRGLGYCLFQQSRHAEAIDAYRRAIAAKPNYDDAYRQLKDAYLSRRLWAEGRQVWQEWRPQSSES